MKIKIINVIFLILLIGSCSRHNKIYKNYLGPKIYISNFYIELKIELKNKEINNVFIKGLFSNDGFLDFEKFQFVEIENLNKKSSDEYTFNAICGVPGKAYPILCEIKFLERNNKRIKVEFSLLNLNNKSKDSKVVFICKYSR